MKGQKTKARIVLCLAEIKASAAFNHKNWNANALTTEMTASHTSTLYIYRDGPVAIALSRHRPAAHNIKAAMTTASTPHTTLCVPTIPKTGNKMLATGVTNEKQTKRKPPFLVPAQGYAHQNKMPMAIKHTFIIYEEYLPIFINVICFSGSQNIFTSI